MPGGKKHRLRGTILAVTVGAMAALTPSPALAGQHGWGRGHREDHHAARELVRSGEILPLRRVLAKAMEQQPGRVLEAEFESEDGRHIYEVMILDNGGKVWELKLDARDGRLLERED